MLRDAALKLIRRLNIKGGCNVQFALIIQWGFRVIGKPTCFSFFGFSIGAAYILLE